MSEENPFKTLGFHPRAFQNLHDGEVFSLVKAQYRVLMQIHHPDVSKRRNASAVSSELSTAFGKINLDSNPAGFDYWKQQFTKPTRSKQTAVGNIMHSTSSGLREEHLQDLAISCLKTVFAGAPEKPTTLPTSVLTVNDGCALLFDDSIKVAWLARLRAESPRWAGLRPAVKSLYEGDNQTASEPTMFELEVTREGLLIYRNLTVSRLRPKDPMPSEKGAWIQRQTTGTGLYWTVRPDKVRVVEARIIGSIDSSTLSSFWDSGGSNTKRTIVSGLNAEETAVIESAGYSTDQIRPFLWLLTPNLRRGDVVVAMLPAEDRFLFLGKLINIAERSKAPRL